MGSQGTATPGWGSRPEDDLVRRPRIREEVLRWARRHLEHEVDPVEVAEHVRALVRRQPALALRVLEDLRPLPQELRLQVLWSVLVVERMFLVQYGDVANPVGAAEVEPVRERLDAVLSDLVGVHSRLLIRRPEVLGNIGQTAVLALILESLPPFGTVDDDDWMMAFMTLALVSESLDLSVDAGLDQRDLRRALYASMSPHELFGELQTYARFPPKELLAQMMGLPRPLTGMLLPWVEELAHHPWADDLPGWGWGPVHALRLLSFWEVPAALPPLMALFEAATASGAPVDDPRDLCVEVLDALTRYGAQAVEPVLDALRLAGPGRPYRRREVLLVTVATNLGVLDPRIRSLLAACQDRDPVWWAERVAVYGDPTLLPVLRGRLRAPRRRTGELLDPEEVDAIRGAIEALSTQEGPPALCQSDILAFYNRRVPPGPDVDPVADPRVQVLLAEAGLEGRRAAPSRAHVPELRLLLPDDEI